MSSISFLSPLAQRTLAEYVNASVMRLSSLPRARGLATMPREWPHFSWSVAVVACLFLRLDVVSARRVVRGGSSNGGEAPQGYGKLDQTTFIVVMCFVGLGVVFCVLGALSRRGVTRLAELDARIAAHRGLKEVEQGIDGRGYQPGYHGESFSLPLPKLKLGDVVRIMKRGVTIEGIGEISKLSPDGRRYHVKWSPNLSNHYTYRPVAGGPAVRAKRQPGPKLGYRREELVKVDTTRDEHDTQPRTINHSEIHPETVQTIVSTTGSVISDPSSLQGLWRGEWRVGKSSVASEFQLILVSHEGGSDTEVFRYRPPPEFEPCAFVTVRRTTGRLVMELGRTSDCLPYGGFGFATTADVFVDGDVFLESAETNRGGDDNSKTIQTFTAQAGWLAKDGTYGTLGLRLVSRTDVEQDHGTDSTLKPTSGVPMNSRIQGSAKARFKAAVHVVRVHGFMNTLRAARKAPRARMGDDDNEGVE